MSIVVLVPVNGRALLSSAASEFLERPDGGIGREATTGGDNQCRREVPVPIADNPAHEASCEESQ